MSAPQDPHRDTRAAAPPDDTHSASSVVTPREDCGTLYIVATPIGNLEDLSPRARRILGEVQLIAAEDTRSARVLLQHCGLNTPLVSCQDHNEEARVPQLVARLLEGEDIALVTDAGVPAISDPGFRVAREAQAQGVRVVGIPGPCAAITALSIAGLPTDRFLFVGFPPPKSQKRRNFLESLRDEPGTLVFYESPNRIVSTLQDIHQTLPGRTVALGRELTKRFEELVRGLPLDVVAHLEDDDGERLRGEMTLLVEGAGHSARKAVGLSALDPTAGLKQLADAVAQALGVSRRDAYKALSRLKEKAVGAEESGEV